VKCPWGCGWEGKPEEFQEHLQSCPEYLRRMVPTEPWKKTEGTEENLVKRYEACMVKRGGYSEAVHIRANAKRVCMAEILNYFIADEIRAQKEYRQLLEVLPEHKIKILEILGDEATHEKELRKILIRVTEAKL